MRLGTSTAHDVQYRVAWKSIRMRPALAASSDTSPDAEPAFWPVNARFPLACPSYAGGAELRGETHGSRLVPLAKRWSFVDQPGVGEGGGDYRFAGLGCGIVSRTQAAQDGTGSGTDDERAGGAH